MLTPGVHLQLGLPVQFPCSNFWKKEGPNVDHLKKINDVKSKTVNITFGSHQGTKTSACFYPYVQNWIFSGSLDLFGTNV